MADPVSVAGTAVGIISLGIQVSQGLIDYYSQWKGFDSDVKAMYSSIQQLDRGFRLIRDQLEDSEFSSFPSAHEVETSIQSCEAGILQLKRKLEKIWVRQPLADLRNKNAFLDDLRSQGKRLLYPFQRGTLGKLRDVVNDLRDGLQPALHALQMEMTGSIFGAIREIKDNNQKQRRDAESQKVHDWLSPLNFHARHQEILSARHPSTGLWFLEHKKFLAWRDAASDVPQGLWCVGNMGTGKSVLLASIVEHLQMMDDSNENVVIYIFCNWQERMALTEGNILGSIVQQIIENFPELPSTIADYYRAYKNGKRQPSVQDLYIMFRESAKFFNRVFIIVDGLDELGNGDGLFQGVSMSIMEGMLKTLLNGEQSKPHRVSILTSSRFEQQLEVGAQCFETIVICAHTEELRTFIRSELGTTSRYIPWVNSQLGRRLAHDTNLRDQVVDFCLLRADKTYLLPLLHVNHLKQQINLKQLLRAARSLSLDISRSIRHTLDRIQSQTDTVRDIAIRTLYWILKAMRPLRINELRHALTLDLEGAIVDDNDSPEDELIQATADEEELVPQALILASCAGLVSVNNHTGIVRLTHLTIAQYLEQLENNWFPPIHASISKVCLAFLSGDEFLTPENGEENRIKHWISKHPFLSYSLEYWGHHARFAPEEVVLDEVKSLISSSNRIDFLFRGLYWVLWGTLGPCAEEIPSLFLTSYFGLTSATRELLAIGQEVDQPDSFGRTPLYMASARGHAVIVETLLNFHAESTGRKPSLRSMKRKPDKAWWLPPWARDDYASEALCVAAESGHIETVQVLIDHNAKVSKAGSFHDGALEGATFSGHTEIARLLLQHDAVITRNTLQSSAYSGRVGILSEFLKILKPRLAGEYVTEKACTQDLPKALYAAALAGNIPYTQKLLEHGVDPNESTITSYRTPLQAAASQGHLDIMKLLIKYGASVDSDVKCKGHHYFDNGTPGTALQAAAFKGQIEAVRLLLQQKADMNLQSGYFGNALQAAAAGGHHDVLRIFLEHKSDVNSDCGFYGNPLQAAASKGSEIVVQALLNAGGDVNAVGGIFGFPLQAAAWGGSPAVIKLLLGSGAELDRQGGRYSTALQAAALGRPIAEPDPQMLISKASSLPLEFQSYASRDLDMLTMRNFRASQVAGSMMGRAAQSPQSSPGTSKLAEHVFGMEGTVLKNNEGEARQEILETSQNSTENIEAVKLLLDAGVDLNKTGGKFHTALQAACYASHFEIAALLLDRGADLTLFLETEDYPCKRDDALTRAIDSGHTSIVKLLLERGADPTIPSARYQTTPLHLAARQNPEMVRLLLAKGASINAIENQGHTPLTYAVRDNKIEIVQLLLQQGADANKGDPDPLYWATNYCPIEITAAILAAGPSAASITAALSPLLVWSHFSAGWTHQIEQIRDPLRLLLAHGADVNIGGTIPDRDAVIVEVCKGTMSPPGYARELHLLGVVAALFGDEVEMVRMVVEAGAELERCGGDALWLATCKGHVGIKTYLEGLGVRFEEGEEEEVLRACERARETEDPWTTVLE